MKTNSLGEKIHELRRERKMTLEEVARSVGVTKSTVRKWETGTIANMRHDKIAALAGALGTTPEYLMGWDTEIGKALPSPFAAEENVRFPVLGDIAAGFDRVALDDWDGDVVEFPASYFRGRDADDYFVLRVKGESMYPIYMDGDRVLMLRQDTVDYSGQVAAVIYDDELATLKRVEYTRGTEMRLIAINPIVPPIRLEGERLDHCRILGIPQVLLRDVK